MSQALGEAGNRSFRGCIGGHKGGGIAPSAFTTDIDDDTPTILDEIGDDEPARLESRCKIHMDDIGNLLWAHLLQRSITTR